jgi:membrane protein
MTWLIGRRLRGKLPMLPSFAAAMAFYLLVSLVPFLIVLSGGAAAVFSANLAPGIIAFLRDVLPPESSLQPDALAASIQQTTRGLAAASALAAFWTASSGVNEMSRAITFLFSDPVHPDTGGWRRRGKSFGVLLIWVAATALGAICFVLLPLIQEQLRRLGAPQLLPSALAAGVRYPVAFAALFAAFFSTYMFLPLKRPSWRAAAQGAALAAAGWAGVSLVFAHLLPKVWHVSLFSGAMSSVLALMMWAYFGSWGALIGAVWTVRADEA